MSPKAARPTPAQELSPPHDEMCAMAVWSSARSACYDDRLLGFAREIQAYEILRRIEVILAGFVDYPNLSVRLRVGVRKKL
jgi:hypothetical protein